MGFDITKEFAKGIAHIYVGIIKADGIISEKENSELNIKRVTNLRSQHIYYLDEDEYRDISAQLTYILDNETFTGMDSMTHLDIGMDLIEKNMSQLDNSKPIFETIKELGRIDGLTLNESKYIKETITRINSLI